MTPVGKVLWQGLAVIDAKGRAQLWNGGQTPKLYRSEEQGRYACTDGSTLEEVTIVLGSVSECAGNVLVEGDPAMVAAFQQRLAEEFHKKPEPRPAPPAVDAPRRRQYKTKTCRACPRTFQPTGGHSLYCPQCQGHE